MFLFVCDFEIGEIIGVDENNEFMEEVVKIGKEGVVMLNVWEVFEMIYVGIDGFGFGDIMIFVEVYNYGGEKYKKYGEVKVKDFSWLWKYRNGMLFIELFLMLIMYGGIVCNVIL